MESITSLDFASFPSHETSVGLMGGSAQRGDVPIKRNVTSSMRIKPVNGCSLPVQCLVGSTVSVSFIDQTLK